MNKSSKEMDAEEKTMQQLAKDINPSEDTTPDSAAEATTAVLEDDELGGNASQNDLKKDKTK